ncbi:UvrD-helicase domain-containing protein [Haloechinothrix sp. LS1_15]|uniref:UvrD-helicase domain-containing protein n=1 Tax=Haloechinothrix sp. LS1_15 TaxID=2652248 RepID=UPI0029443542|nr:UvrD-helicase domain-containing protein [Haloechinothrix sp. LS1_15]MDV6013924.1 AAA family ATPase [Haloechinothrix sp. LS1_15]
MRFHADLHIHSKYSRACSKDCDLHHLSWWARRKGITVVGTGDFTHPAWFDHLRECLEPAEQGLFRMRADIEREITRTLPPAVASNDVRFMLSVEISTIYKRDGLTRKIHHLIYVPDFTAAAEFNRRLGRIGNLGSDGRPIVGLDSRDLLEITLESGEGSYLVPAHIWTPWFAVLGSKSGFDRISDCYADLADHITALETGLSSDPEMNWRISELDRYRLVSNSDAHSPPMLGREATVFDTELDYFAIRHALDTGHGHAGTVEFFPEEGKYHVDGHRKCGVRMQPPQTREHGGHCPECGKPLTVGVLNRVDALADRQEGSKPPGAADYRCLVPLPEIVSEILGTGPKSKKVLREIDQLTAAFGSELAILQDVDLDDVLPRWPLLAEAVSRLRRGEVIREPGYDGEYGVIKLFHAGELRRLNAVHTPALFDALPEAPEPSTPDGPSPRSTPRVASETAGEPTGKERAAPARPPVAEVQATGSLLDALDPDQRAAAEPLDAPLLIVAGPGTGKTRTLTHRIAYLVTERGVSPRNCLAITFTRRAAEEMTERLATLAPEQAGEVTIATFHSLGARILREQHHRVGVTGRFGIADEATQLAVAGEVAGGEAEGKRLLSELSRARRHGSTAAELPHRADRYVAALRAWDLVDFDELVALPTEILESDPDLAASYRERYRWISVDEYQDTDGQQYRLLRQLATQGAGVDGSSSQGGITAIGDPDQAIYRFRGADVSYFLRFQQDFPGARTVHLGRNYRSSDNVLGAAMRVITPGSLVPGRSLHPVGDHGTARVGLHRAATPEAEASFVARTIERLLGGASFHSLDSGRVSEDGTQGLGFGDFAVLYRTDRQARAVADALTQAGLPFQKRSHDRLADRPGVSELVTELRFVPEADRGSRSDRAGSPQRLRDRLRVAADAVLARRENPEPGEVERINTAVDLLTPLAERCGTDLERMLTELSLGVEVDTWDPRADRVSLLTLHAAKGLEFAVVFIVGCEDGLLPLRWPGTNGDGADEQHREEERRLLFVGMTRAQRHLYLSHAAERTVHGSTRPAEASPFLAELDDRTCERIGDTVPRKRNRQTQLRLL